MKTILVIEDDPIIQDFVSSILEKEGFRTLVANNGRRGLQLAQQYQPDLIISDLMLPELDGYGLLKALRQDLAINTIPLIFLTAKTDRESFRQGMELGADDYISKPFTQDELLKAIQTRLARQANILDRCQIQIGQLKDELIFTNHHDALTQLPNWQFLQWQFNQICTQAQRYRLIPLMVIGIDQYSWMRSNVGYAYSQMIIQAVAEHLQRQVDGLQCPLALLGRLEADQFALLPGDFDHPTDIADLAQLLIHSFSQPLRVKEQTVAISVSLGIALHPSDTQDIDMLVSYARVAMQQSKSQGGNRHHFYTDVTQLDPAQQVAIATELPRAIEQGEFQLYYQPQVDLRTGQLMGTEALVRWYHPEWGVVSPGKFIPIAEQTGLILPLGEWVLRTACQQAQAWHQKFSTPFTVAVNISAHQFDHPELTQFVRQVLAETNLNPEYLEIELTESTLMRDTAVAIQTMQDLKAIGISLSIDDFGVGYSSLSYLQQLPFDTLKIDRCFVSQIDTNQANAAITSAVISMAHDLHLTVIGEGVETVAERDFLAQHQCDAVQGYLISPPLPAFKFESLLQTQSNLMEIAVS